MKTLPSDLSENLDGFPSPDDLRVHAASVAEIAPGCYLQYADYKAKAMELRAAGKIVDATLYERSCDTLYCQLPAAWRW